MDFCLDPNTELINKEGKKKMKYLKDGEEVLTPDGYKKCKNPHYTAIKQVVEIKLKDGKILRCSEDHEIYVRRGRRVCKIKAKELKSIDEVIINGK